MKGEGIFEKQLIVLKNFESFMMLIKQNEFDECDTDNKLLYDYILSIANWYEY